jgi:peptidoglycan lytic transglycosylase G
MKAALLVFVVLACLLVAVAVGVPAAANRTYGPPSGHLNPIQVWQYSASLLWADGLLTKPLDAEAPEIEFQVKSGETVDSICDRLAQAGLIRDAWMLRDYLIYSGLDTSVQAGAYRLSASMSAVDLARQMQDATPQDVKFVILPGWRIEEIAASLPTSGLNITSEDFVASAASVHPSYAFLAGASTTEGFLYPDSYVLPRSSTADDLIDAFLRNFGMHLSATLEERFGQQGLSVREAVTLASIVQREAVKIEEAPAIASVYLNRLRAQMRLEADPTVQYALGYNVAQGTWWTNPLSLDDLKTDSPYNTYANDGLPPAPIANPGLQALEAVASPAETSYYYFSARCDGSGYHEFAETFEAHLQNLCP